MNGCGESDWPNCPTKPDGFKRNSCPSNWPKKNSVLMGPSHPRKLGNLRGVVRLIRNMLIGRELLLSVIEPPSPGPHERLCFPKETCQFDSMSPAYVSRNSNCWTEGLVVPGCSGR